MCKLRRLYESQPANYYAQDHLKSAWHTFFGDLPPSSHVINVGCGRGESLLKWPNGVGIDFNRNLQPIWKQLKIDNRTLAISLEKWTAFCFNQDISYDITISTDFLEHTEPDKINNTLEDLHILSPCGRHVICTSLQSSFRGPAGENLHTCAMTNDWWIEKLTDFFDKRIRTIDIRGAHIYVEYHA